MRKRVGLQKRLVILIYHRVLDEPDPLRPYDPDKALFDRQIRQITRWWHVLPLREGISRLRDGTLPARALSITFDDGYEDNLSNAIPILNDYDAAATFFVTTGYLGDTMMFNDLVIEAVRKCKDNVITLPESSQEYVVGKSVAERLNGIASVLGEMKYRNPVERHELAEGIASRYNVDTTARLMLTIDQVREMRDAGMEVGAHTERHPALGSICDAEATAEVQNSKDTLEEILQEEIHGFAYPFGKSQRDFGERDVDVVKAAKFKYALTTDWSTADAGTDVFKLPRLSLGASSWRNFATVLKGKLRR